MFCRTRCADLAEPPRCLADEASQVRQVRCSNSKCSNQTPWKDAILCHVCIERRQALTGQFNQPAAPWVEYAAKLVKLKLGNLTDGASNLVTKKFACSKAQFEAMKNHIKYILLDTPLERMHVSPVYRLGGIGSRQSAWQFQLQSGIAVKRFMQTCFTGEGEKGSMRIYPEKHAVCIVPSMVFTLRLDQNFYAGIGAIGQAQVKFDLMGWSPRGDFRQAANIEYDELALNQIQLYMMHLAAELQSSGIVLSPQQAAVVRRFSSASEEEAGGMSQ